MSEFAVYETTAQISVGLVGFAALLNYLSQNSNSMDAHTGARGDYMLETAVMALVASLLPETCSRLNLESNAIWQIGSAFLAIYFATLVGRSFLLVKKTGWGATVFHLAPSLMVLVASMFHQGLNVFSSSWPEPENVYYLGVVVLIISSASTFLAQYKLENQGVWRGPK